MKFIFLIFLSLLCNPAIAKQCGNEGSIATRISDCAKAVSDGNGGSWHLVTIVETNYNTYRVWKEEKSNSIWTAIFLASQEDANEICKPKTLEFPTGNLDSNWKIASYADYTYVHSLNILHRILGKRDSVGNGWGNTFWIDEESEMIDISSGKKVSNHPSNTMPVVCRASL